MHLSIRVLPLLLTITAACESREIYVPPPTQLEPQACPAAPAPEAPVCSPPPVCSQPRDPVAIPGLCPPPPVCPAPPAPPAPVVLSVNLTPLEPLRADLRATWSAAGCTPAGGLELLGEAGQIVSVGNGETVSVAQLTRPGVPLVQRFSVWARVTCTDGRSQTVGPLIVTDAVRALRTVERSIGTYYNGPVQTVHKLKSLPGGALAFESSVIVGTERREFIFVHSSNGAIIIGEERQAARSPADSPPNPYYPWVEGTRVVFALSVRLGVEYYYRSADFTTGETLRYYNLTPFPPAAIAVPVRPAGLNGWAGPVAVDADDPRRAWIAPMLTGKNSLQLALVELAQ